MAETKKIRKFFLVWEFEKEEQWLNEMARSGWVLDKVGFCVYHFVPSEPGEYIVRLEMHEKDEAYISFMEETGAEYVGRMAKWIFFRRRSDLGQFDIFSDIDSKLSQLNKIAKMLTAVGFANLAIGLANSFNTSFGWINLLCATLLMYALGRIHGKIEALEKERLFRE